MSENSSTYNNAEADLSFSNRDHLEWNQKKHNMMLNLGLTNNSETDQTPTPTRFIRNCEEVGLFQDLQNVNPFDEVFKKAVENPRAISLQVPVSTSDDTLHTPQIYPSVEENSSVPKNNIDQRDDEENPLIIVLDPEKDSDEEKPSASSLAEIPKECKGSITPVPLTKLLDCGKCDIRKTELVRQREANKAAQSRCRKRKQKQFEDMKVENKILKKENYKLTSANLLLQQTIKKLQEKLKEATSSKDTAKLMARSKQISIDKFNGEMHSNDTSKTVFTVSSSDKAIIGASSEVNPLQNIQNTITQSSTSTSDKVSPQKIQMPPALAPKPVVISLPMQSGPQDIQNNSNTVVLVYPQSTQTVTLPMGHLQKVDNYIIKDRLKRRFKKIMPK